MMLSSAQAATVLEGQAPATSSTTTNIHTPKRITNPRRLFVIAPSIHSSEVIPSLLHSLTGEYPSAPTAASTSAPNTTDQDSRSNSNDDGDENDNNNQQTHVSFSGYTTHTPFQISNKYYTADIPIWVDEIPLSSPPDGSHVDSQKENGAQAKTEVEAEAEASKWEEQFLSSEARDVRDAIGAILVCVKNVKGLSRAVPREAYEDLNRFSSEVGNEREAGDLMALVNANNKDPLERGDVKDIMELMRIAGVLRSKIEEERNRLEDDETRQFQSGAADVPALLIFVDSHGDPSTRLKKRENDDDEDGLEIAEPFTPPWWEDVLYDRGIHGFEVISWTQPSSTVPTAEGPETRNVYGELEGLPRIKEVLSTHEWAGSSSYSGLVESEDEDDILKFLVGTETRKDTGGFKGEADQLEREMMELRLAINQENDTDNDDDGEESAAMQVDNLEALMMRVRAIKEMSTEIPESKRKQFAAKAVRDIMRDF